MLWPDEDSKEYPQGDQQGGPGWFDCPLGSSLLIAPCCLVCCCFQQVVQVYHLELLVSQQLSWCCWDIVVAQIDSDYIMWKELWTQRENSILIAWVSQIVPIKMDKLHQNPEPMNPFAALDNTNNLKFFDVQSSLIRQQQGNWLKSRDSKYARIYVPLFAGGTLLCRDHVT